MIRLFWKGALATALICAAVSGQPTTAAEPTSSKKKSTPTSTTTKTDHSAKGELIVLQEKGKPDRKCTIVSSTPRPDGTVSHQVKALDNGEMMTIVEPKKTGTVSVAPSVRMPAEKQTAAQSEKPKTTKLPTTMTSAKPSVKTESVPSAKNPPAKPTETQVATKSKPTETQVVAKPASVEMPKGAQFPMIEAPVGTASISEPAPISRVEPAMMPATRIAVPVSPYNPVQQASAQSAQLKEMLKEALQPAHREMAAEGLCTTSQGTSHEVRQMLLTAVQQDPAPSVRATCLRCLAKQNMMDEVFQTAMTSAQKDQDARVRNEAKMISQKMMR